MLTINADADPLFRDHHQTDKEKRLVVTPPEAAYGDWLTASADQSRACSYPSPQTSWSPRQWLDLTITGIHWVFEQVSAMNSNGI